MTNTQFDQKQNAVFRYKKGTKILHCEDGPAVIEPNGTSVWYKDGRRHRTDGPALESLKVAVWYKEGYIHREDGPAIEWSDGRLEWRQGGDLHRTDGPAIIRSDGTALWYVNGKAVADTKFLNFIINKKANT